MKSNVLEGDDLYNNVLEGHDFSYFQDCNYNPEDSTHGYEEHYFNPDHVVLYPDNKLDHNTQHLLIRLRGPINISK